jgi:hypothetical protein
LVVIKLKKPGESPRWRAHGRGSAATARPRPATPEFARRCAAWLSPPQAPAVVSASTTALSVTVRSAMADRIELFERRNRLRIVALVVLATLNYIDADTFRSSRSASASSPSGPR